MTAHPSGLFLWINHFARSTPWLHAPMQGFASYGIVLFAGFLLAAWWLARSRPDESMARALWAPVGTLLAVAVNQPMVAAFHEARPYTTDHHILVLANHSTDPSFPSDHATMAGAVALGVLLVDRRLGIIAWVTAVLLAFSRVYIAAHYPHDVLAGLALGALVSGLGYLLLRALGIWLVGRLRHGPLAPLVVQRNAVGTSA
jgi:undecaprenyl-diphosphatase